MFLELNQVRNRTPTNHQRIGKAFSEKNEFNLRDSLTNSMNSSDDSFRVYVQIDQEKIRKQNQEHAHNPFFHVQDVMSSTNETQDKECNALRFPQLSPRKSMKETYVKKYRNGRFVIKKYKEEPNKQLSKTHIYDNFSQPIRDDVSDQFDQDELIFERHGKAGLTMSPHHQINGIKSKNFSEPQSLDFEQFLKRFTYW